MPTATLALDDAIIAVVNNEPITFGELNDYMKAIYVNLATSGKSQEEIKEIMTDVETEGLKRLIDDLLIVSEAKQRGVEVRAKAIDEKVEEVKKQYRSDEEFMEALISNGSTLSDLRDKIKQQMQLAYIIDTEIRSKIVVTPHEITKYYEEHVDEFRKPEQLNLDSIIISAGENPKESKEKAKAALNLVQKGEDFAKVIKEYSDAPSIGSINKGQMQKDIEDTLFKLKPGEISSLIEVEGGFYIFKVNEKLPGKIASLEETRDYINDRLFQKRFEERYKEWIEQLRENAYIEIKE